MIFWLLALMFPAGWPSIQQVPAGTPLHIRLTAAVGSYASRAGTPVDAVLIAPVLVDGRITLTAGSIVTGTVKTVTRVGLGIRHETAALDLEFSRMTLPHGETIPIIARVAQVDNGRERVSRNGNIRRLRSTASLCYRISGYVRTLLRWQFHGEIAEWAIKSLVVKLPEPEIYYPAGVEFTLTLDRKLIWTAPLESAPITRQLTGSERADLNLRIATQPYRTCTAVSRRPSDLTNVLLAGSREQIVAAFAAAGWNQPNPESFRFRIGWVRALAETGGYRDAPMSSLLLNGAEADMSWQKGLNDISKRHHIRLWRQPGTLAGRELWIGAATRDVDFAYLRPGRTVTHRIEESVDQERDKVAYDLAFTSCVNLLDWTERPTLPRAARNATGDLMTTDARLAVIGLDDCPAPRLSARTADLAIPSHGTGLQRFARREILSARSDLIRTNPYWRTYEGARWIVEYIRRRERPQ